jgi:hypothetical protein
MDKNQAALIIREEYPDKQIELVEKQPNPDSVLLFIVESVGTVYVTEDGMIVNWSQYEKRQQERSLD